MTPYADSQPCFTAETFRFLKDLAKHNDRDWFAANKHRYEEELKAPALRIVEAFGPELKKISPHFMATPRSLFRIHRDVRFSKDKRPYKTHIGLHFRHDLSKDAHAPGFYLHVEPGNVFLGAGIWHPPTAALRKIRDRIVEEPDQWKRVSRSKTLTRTFELSGDRLKRAPKGFDPEHPLIEELKWKDFIGVAELDEDFVRRPSLPREMGKTLAPASQFVAFLCEALEVPF